jgi:hypothetical protein
MATDHRWLCEQNIARFRSQLENAGEDQERRRRLLALLAEEQSKLDQIARPREPR